MQVLYGLGARKKPMKRIDVISICNALVDLVYEANDQEIAAHGLTKGTMHLVDRCVRHAPGPSMIKPRELTRWPIGRPDQRCGEEGYHWARRYPGIAAIRRAAKETNH